MQTESKRFDETYVECTECSHYWTDACDGVPKDKVRQCTSYKATKKVDLVEKVQKLQVDIKGIDRILLMFAIVFLMHLICDFIWR